MLTDTLTLALVYTDMTYISVLSEVASGLYNCNVVKLPPQLEPRIPWAPWQHSYVNAHNGCLDALPQVGRLLAGFSRSVCAAMCLTCSPNQFLHKLCAGRELTVLT